MKKPGTRNHAAGESGSSDYARAGVSYVCVSQVSGCSGLAVMAGSFDSRQKTGEQQKRSNVLDMFAVNAPNYDSCEKHSRKLQYFFLFLCNDTDI